MALNATNVLLETHLLEVTLLAVQDVLPILQPALQCVVMMQQFILDFQSLAGNDIASLRAWVAAAGDLGVDSVESRACEAERSWVNSAQATVGAVLPLLRSPHANIQVMRHCCHGLHFWGGDPAHPAGSLMSIAMIRHVAFATASA